MDASEEQQFSLRQLQQWYKQLRQWSKVYLSEKPENANNALPCSVQEWFQQAIDALIVQLDHNNMGFFKNALKTKELNADSIDSLLKLQDMAWEAPDGSLTAMHMIWRSAIGTMAYQTGWNMDELNSKHLVLQRMLGRYTGQLDPLLDAWVKDLCEQRLWARNRTFEWHIQRDPIVSLDWVYSQLVQPTKGTMHEILTMHTKQAQEPYAKRWTHLTSKRPDLAKHVESIVLLHQECLGKTPSAQYLVEQWLNKKETLLDVPVEALYGDGCENQ